MKDIFKQRLYCIKTLSSDYNFGVLTSYNRMVASDFGEALAVVLRCHSTLVKFWELLRINVNICLISFQRPFHEHTHHVKVFHMPLDGCLPTCTVCTLHTSCMSMGIIEGVRVRVGQPSIYNSRQFSFKYVLKVLIEQTGKEL